MVAVRRSATIQASPEAIWEFLADRAHWSHRDPDIIIVGIIEIGIVDGGLWPVRVKPGWAERWCSTTSRGTGASSGTWGRWAV
ncbi:MAG: hypothetical protein OEV40_24025 [Acidimicrobiia bacterium]|nr:hypothetical protein [Acidimicrobiia bacterium]